MTIWRPTAEVVRAIPRKGREVLETLDLGAFADGRYTGSGHLKLRRPCGCAVTISCTPRDHRAVKNITADVRRLNAAHDNRMAVCQQ